MWGSRPGRCIDKNVQPWANGLTFACGVILLYHFVGCAAHLRCIHRSSPSLVNKGVLRRVEQAEWGGRARQPRTCALKGFGPSGEGPGCGGWIRIISMESTWRNDCFGPLGDSMLSLLSAP